MKNIVLFLSILILAFSLYVQDVSADFDDNNSSILQEMKNKPYLELLDRQIRYRTDNNLDASLATINMAIENINSSNLQVKQQAEASLLTYGVALTMEEINYLKDRDEKMNFYAPIIVKIIRGDNELSKLGLFYQETSNGLKFHIGLSKDANKSTIKQEILSAIPENLVVFHDIQYTEEELVKAYSKIVDGKEIFQNKGIKINKVIVNAQNDLVDINIDPNSSELSETLLDQEYGKIVKVIREGVNIQSEARNSVFTTMVGGLSIQGILTNNPGYQANCSTGFTATKGTDRFVVTAGHCIPSVTNWSQGGQAIGTSHYYYEGNYADVGLIKINGTRLISSYVYKYSGFDSSYSSYETNQNNVIVGDKVCLSAATTNFQCGQVNAVYASGPSGNYYVETSGIDSDTGDSGGTYYYNGILKGIHSGGEISGAPIRTYYTHVSRAIQYGGGFTPYTSTTPY